MKHIPENWRECFGLVIKRRRETQGLGQAELGQKSGYSPATISKIEGGRQDVTLWQFCQLANSLDWSATELVRAWAKECRKHGIESP